MKYPGPEYLVTGEYDECEHGVPLSHDCIECLKRNLCELHYQLDEEVEKWQMASGLMKGGDPGGVSPETLERHQEAASNVIREARDWLDHLRTHGKGRYLDGIPGELMDALDRYDSEYGPPR